MWGFFASLLVFGSVVSTEHFGMFPLVIGLLLLEIITVRWNRYDAGFSMVVALLLGGIYLTYAGASFLEFNALLSIGLYMLVRHKGDSWFIDNKINSYVYLLFAISVPVFLLFVTLLINIEWSMLMFTTLYLVFLRISDQIITKKIPLILFVGTQSIALNIFNSLVHVDNSVIMLIVMMLIIWAIAKWHQGGQYNVSKIFTRALYRESGKRVYQRLS